MVASDGAAWLPRVLDALATQTYRNLQVIAVDNGSTDGSLALLLQRLGDDRLLVAERDLGWPAAIAMALDTAAAARAEWLLLVHDDVALDRDAVTKLIGHARANPDAAIVGPKLVSWDDERRLSEVGLSIDLTGRPDSGLEPDELDQGQRDHPRPVLSVSTAGMLVRRDVFEQLGRFDRRYGVFGNGLDLCWRAWLAGHDVEVVPAAIGSHVAAAAAYARAGETARLGPRYLSERNTLATLIKCYGPVRLLLVLPLYLVVGIAKMVGFVATRRFSDAWQTLRAWGWNLRALPGTLRLRRVVQTTRVRTDTDLQPLFVRTTPRVRAYAEAVAEWLTGGEADVIEEPPEVQPGEPATASRRFVLLTAAHPVFVVGTLLAIVGLVAAAPLLAGGQIRGGDLAPWPSSPWEFLRAYGSAWADAGGAGSSQPPSPAQAVLGMVGLLTFGSAWLAQRVLLFAPLLLGWLLAMRAARMVTPRRLPRVVVATAYVLSPPAIAALTTGRVGALAAVAIAPAMVIAGTRAFRPDAPSGPAWSATAGTALLGALLVAFEPPAAWLLLVAAVVVLIGVSVAPVSAARRRRAAVRLAVATLAVPLLLFPWTLTLFADGSPLFGGFGAAGASPTSFLRWLALAPGLAGFPGLAVGLAFPAVGLAGAAVAGRHRAGLVLACWTVALAATYAAWGLSNAGETAWAWPGLPALVAVLAYCALLAVASSSIADLLARHSFGWRQVSFAVSSLLLAIALGAAGIHLLADPWGAYAVSRPALPAFLETEAETVGPYRLLVLTDDAGVLRWDLTGAEGPTMLRYGAARPAALVALVSEGLTEVTAAADPAAAGLLGLANVRYVVVPEAGRSVALERVLAAQLNLEPLPVAEGLVYQVGDWLPRAAFLPTAVAQAVARRGELPPGAEVTALEAGGDDRYTGAAASEGDVLLAEAHDPRWAAEADGSELTGRESHGLVGFHVPRPAEDVVVTYAGQRRRTAALVLQAVLAAAAFSFVLRPPRFAQDRPTADAP